MSHHQSLLRCSILTAALLLAAPLTRAEENLNRPTVKPTAVIPLLAKAPVIDGVIGDGEWGTLHVSRFTGQQQDLLQQRPGEFWVGSDGKRLYIAVRSGVHPTAGAVTKNTEKVSTKDEQAVVFDDSIELWFHNAPQGGAGEYYQVMVNSAGVLFDAEFDAAEKVGRTYWRVAMEQAHKVEKGLWTAEFAIDLASLKIKDATQPLALRVCRNFKHGWDQSRWAPRVIAFDAPETMPLVRFAAAAPVVSEVGFQDDKGICVAVDLSNSTSQPLPVTVKLGYNAESQPRYFQETPVTLAPGETKRFEYRKDFFTGDNYPALAELLVTGAGGVVYYHRDVKWETKPKAPAWTPMGDAPPDQAVQFGFEFHPTPRVARWKVDFAGMKGRETIKEVRFDIVPVAAPTTGRAGSPSRPPSGSEPSRVAEDGRLGQPALPTAQSKPVFQTTATPSENFTVPVRTETLKGLRDGLYLARVFVGSDQPVKTAAFQLKTDFPWLNNQIGKDDIVIPPFTPMEVKGQTIRTVLREHQLAGNGLWEQITAEGRPILAGPMRIEVVRDGKVEIVTGKAKVTGKKPTAVTARGDWQAAAVKGRTETAIEYDGCAKVTLTFEAKDKQPIEALRLVIPLAEKEARLMHAVGDGIRFNYAGKVPTGDGSTALTASGLVWSSDKASRSQLLGTFLPYLWVGGESRGLCWFAGTDRDWVLDPADKAPALALYRRNGALELEVNLVQVPVTLDRPHTVVFGLQATPARPMPENWRRLGIASTTPVDYKILGMCMYWGCDLYTVAPRGGDYEIIRKITAAATENQRDDAYIEAYKQKHPDIAAEINWSAQPGKTAGVIPYTNLRGGRTSVPEWFVYQDEWRKDEFSERVLEPGTGGPIDFCVALPPSRVDFLLYHYQKFIENGFAAPYWDNIYIVGNANPASGDAYPRANGGVQPEADIWRIREVTKRTAVMLHKLGKPNVSVPHMTNGLLVPAFAWTGFNLDWEWKYGATDFQDRFNREYIRATSIGRQNGGIPLVIDGIKDPRTAEERAWVERTRIAACVPHEIKVWQTDGLFAKLTQAMLDLGYGTPDCVVHNYWEENPVVRLTGVDGIFLALRGKNRVMIVIGDYGTGGDAKLTLDLARLGLPAGFTATDWEDSAKTYTAQGDTVTIPGIRKHDFRVLLVSGAKP